MLPRDRPRPRTGFSVRRPRRSAHHLDLPFSGGSCFSLREAFRYEIELTRSSQFRVFSASSATSCKTPEESGCLCRRLWEFLNRSERRKRRGAPWALTTRIPFLWFFVPSCGHPSVLLIPFVTLRSVRVRPTLRLASSIFRLPRSFATFVPSSAIPFLRSRS